MCAVKLALLLCSISFLVGKSEAGFVDGLWDKFDALLAKFGLRAGVEPFTAPENQEVATFNEKLQGYSKQDRVVVVYFGADFCTGCKNLAADIEIFRKKFANRKIIFLKVDVQEFPDVKKVEKVDGIPTLRIYKKGRLLEQVSGYKKGKLEEMVNAYNKKMSDQELDEKAAVMSKGTAGKGSTPATPAAPAS